MKCSDDKAAKDAITFVTMFPQRLSPELMLTGHVLSLRQVMLRTCMTELESVRNSTLVSQGGEIDCSAVIGESKKLRRTLMLLHALIDESMADAGTRVHPHGGRWKSRMLSIKIQYSQKTIPYPVITLDSNDSLEHMMEIIAEVVGKPLSELKMFRKGKEIILGIFRRTLQQVDIAMNEVILVADRPKPSTFVNSSVVANTALGSYDCPVESLPSVVLSNTPEYLDLLFALLDISSGSLCDDIWGLILRLPTSPSVLRGWENVESMVESSDDTSSSPLCLFSIHSSDASTSETTSTTSMGDGGTDHSPIDGSGKRIRVTKSPSRLLYNMQVIENKLHSDEQQDSDDDWVTMFIFMGGIPAIGDAMEFTASQVEEFMTATNPSATCGVTTKLLLCTMGLATKMYRAIVLRSALTSREDSAEHVQLMLDIFSHFVVSDSATDNSKASGPNVNAAALITTGGSSSADTGGVEESKDGASSAKVPAGEDEDKENCLPSVGVSGASTEVVSATNAMHLPHAIISSEWGNKLNFFASAASDVIVSSVDLTKVQCTVCKLLTHVRGFSTQSIFHMDGSDSTPGAASSISSRASIQSAQDEFLEAVKNMFVIWASSVILKPDVLGGVEFREIERPDDMEIAHASNFVATAGNVVDSSVLIQSLLMGYELENIRGKSANGMRKSFLSGVVSMLAVDGLAAVIEIGSKASVSDDEPSSVHGYIYSAFMQSILALRPAINSSPPPADDIDSKMHFSAESLFSFASRLIALRAGVATCLPEKSIERVCETILGEFEEVLSRNSLWQRHASGKYLLRSQLKYVSGSMQLLTNLAMGEPVICDFLMQHHIIPFVVLSCVGIVPRQQISLTTLCTDKESRYVQNM
jgi:hypothetical protein